MSAIKRERSEDAEEVKPSKSKKTSTPKKSHSDSSTTSPSSPSAKTRLPTASKRKIAEEIIKAGIGSIDVAKVVRETGLTTQQVRSQLADNRQNVRKQLMELAGGLS